MHQNQLFQECCHEKHAQKSLKIDKSANYAWFYVFYPIYTIYSDIYVHFPYIGKYREISPPGRYPLEGNNPAPNNPPPPLGKAPDPLGNNSPPGNYSGGVYAFFAPQNEKKKQRKKAEKAAKMTKKGKKRRK